MTSMDDEVNAYARAVTAAAQDVEGVVLVGSYLHGSAVLGGFVPGRSDIDLLLVLEGPTAQPVAQTLGEVLISVASCPGAGLEASVVAQAAAKVPAPPWPFVVHATSTPGDRKVVVGEYHGGDPDLALHYAVVHQYGWAVHGPPAAELVGLVQREVILDALRDELRWSLEHAPMAYAVLNAARALRYAVESTLCSKLDGGEWAIDHGEPADIIEPALDRQRTGAAAMLTAAQEAWVNSIAQRL